MRCCKTEEATTSEREESVMAEHQHGESISSVDLDALQPSAIKSILFLVALFFFSLFLHFFHCLTAIFGEFMVFMCLFVFVHAL